MSAIVTLIAREILDSRGFPTVEAEVSLACGAKGRACVPSGASTGRHEAVEKRDGDSTRYLGKGTLHAVHTVTHVIAPQLLGKNALEQQAIDQFLQELDGTPNKASLGANAMLAVSLAIAKAAAQHLHLPLYRYLGGPQAGHLPMPMLNIINGGAHSDNGLDIQEFMIIPVGAPTFREALRMGTEVFHTLKSTLQQRHCSTNVGDEGGFAPPFTHTHQALDAIMHAIENAGYRPGSDIGLALDVAASELYRKGAYHFSGTGEIMSAREMTSYFQKLAGDYPLLSLEDPLAEDDFSGWQHLNQTLGDHLQIVGDDLFVTNTQRLQMGIKQGWANSILIKPNQIGTLSETLDTIDLAHRNGMNTIISHRSGETEDTTIADLAVAVNSGQIKTGAPSRTDRVAKYNQLLRIEESLGDQAIFSNPFKAAASA